LFDTIFYNATVFHRGKLLKNYNVFIQDGKIVDVTSSSVVNITAREKIDLNGEILAPGYIDMHIHGFLDYLIDTGKESLESISKCLPKFGVTSFLPSILPHDPQEEENFLHELATADAPGAEYLGFFMEGPYLALTGAINPDGLIDKTPERVLRIKEALKPYLVVFAISPEIPNLESIMANMDQPIFITHTQAGVVDSQKAIALGANHATHFYDVFYIPEETDPGVRPCGSIEAILQDPKISVDFVLDGVHVDPIAVKLALLCKSAEKVCLITDSNIGAGKAPGIYPGFGGDEIIFAYPGGPARGTEKSRYPGSLHGSGLTMDLAVCNVMKFGVGTLETALTMASTSPAKVLNVYGQKGDIAVGFDADILHLDLDLKVKQTWVRGRSVYKSVKKQKTKVEE